MKQNCVDHVDGYEQQSCEPPEAWIRIDASVDAHVSAGWYVKPKFPEGGYDRQSNRQEPEENAMLVHWFSPVGPTVSHFTTL